eukprot:SAG31_NODE_4331_length_3346_cov_1.723745_5_plen_375_part_00
MCWLLLLLLLGLPRNAEAVNAVPAPRCVKSSTVTVTLRWSRVSAALKGYDVHVAEDNSFSAGRSITTANTSVVVDDLLPGHTYYFALRWQSAVPPFAWRPLSPSVTCETLPLAQTQAHLLPPIDPPLRGSITVRLGQPEWLATDTRTLLGWELQWRLANSDNEWVPAPALVTARQRKFNLSGLPSGSLVEVRAVAQLRRQGNGDVREPGIPSEPVLYSTADPVAEPVTMLRMSELCDANCSVDFISNHDSGSGEGDQLFATLMATMPVPNPMDVVFNMSVTTRYCVHRDASWPFANYASCDGPTPELYQCVCNDMMDHCFGRLPCKNPTPGRTNASCPQCADCTADVLAQSLRYVGRMAIYLPMFEFPTNPVRS